MNKIAKNLTIVGVSALILTGLFMHTSIVSAQSTQGTVSSNAWSGGCLTFPRSLYRGMRGDGNVTVLQNFLISQGFLAPGNATGYFGSLTWSATRSFQASNNISATGFVGPLTRARINTISCRGVIVPPPANQFVPVITSMSPGSGGFGTQVTLTGQNFTRTGNSINFGNTNQVITNLESYDGTTLRFTVPSSPCNSSLPGMYCTMIAYAPGPFPLSVTTVNGTSNTLTFNLTSGNNALAPVLSGMSGPTSIGINQTGTWSVTAMDPNHSALTYSVLWGDESQYANGVTAVTPIYNQSQTSTFTHSYSAAGTYTIRFTVRAANGMTSTGTMTIIVSNNGYPTTQAPTINYITPASGPAGTLVTVYGTNFNNGSRSVSYANMNYLAHTVNSDGTMLQFTIPSSPCSVMSGVSDCSLLAPGQYPIRITTNGGSSNTVYFTLTYSGGSTQAPIITSLSPSYGPFGTVVTITGSNFSTYGNSINFAGVNRAAINVNSMNNGTQLQFTVPATPCSDGNICTQVALGSGSYPVSVNTIYGTSNTLTYTVPVGSTNVNQYVTVSVGQSGSADGVEVIPLSVIEDSRCPVGVYCIQAGRVAVQTNIRIANGGSNNTVTLTSDGEYYTTTDGHRIKITNVTPTKYQSSINQGDYRITYFITR